MSKEAMMAVLDKAAKNIGFRVKLIEDPYETLKAFDLTEEEKEALLSGEQEDLERVGLDSRVAGWVWWRAKEIRQWREEALKGGKSE